MQKFGILIVFLVFADENFARGQAKCASGNPTLVYGTRPLFSEKAVWFLMKRVQIRKQAYKKFSLIATVIVEENHQETVFNSIFTG